MDFHVKNLDTGEDMHTTSTLNSSFSMLSTTESKEKEGAYENDAKISFEDEDDDDYFDATLQEQMSRTMAYHPIVLPEGAHVRIHRISAVGSSKDLTGKQFTVFYIDVRCAQVDPPTWTVYRRYSEFKTLSDKLRSEGCAVPLLPPKRLIGAFEIDFLRKRKDELEVWLKKLEEPRAGGMNAVRSEHYTRFLHDDANLPPRPLSRVWPAVETETGVVKSTKVGLADFEIIRVLGKGSFGKVTLVRKKANDKLYAMKSLSRTVIARRKQIEHTRTERRVLEKITHPFIVKLHYAFQTDKKLYFVLDYAAGGELFYHLERMKKFPENYAIFYAAELTLALEELHRNDVVYRDLKPENILFDGEGHVKLADFGLAKENVSEATDGAHSICGTPQYLSPEVLNRQPHGYAVDWWNLGMVIFEFLTGLPPWYTRDTEVLFERIKEDPLVFPRYISPKAQSLIEALLNRNPKERLGSRGAQEVKEHPFFGTIDWVALMRRQIVPPFNPCQGKDVSMSTNFDSEFTSMPVHSIDDISAAEGRLVSGTFSGFTFSEENADEK